MRIVMTSPTDGWALGMPPTGVIDSTILLHYHNGAWTRVPTPENTVLTALAMSSPSDGWAFGSRIFSQRTGGSTSSLAFHYSGGSWQSQDFPLGFVSDAVSLAPTNVWAVGSGTSGSGALIAHYDGLAWRAVANPFDGDRSSGLQRINMTADGQGWAIGNSTQPAAFLATPIVLRYAAGAWSALPNPLSAALLDDLAATPTGELWISCVMAGDTPNPRLLLHYDGSSWQALPLANAAVIGVAMASSTEGWAVGSTNQGTNQGSNQGAFILHYHNGIWTPYQP